MNRKINVEGNEMFETPLGEVGTFQGASHSQGGIDTNVPTGTKIYSDKIKIGGNTMADRKAFRTKMITKILAKHGATTDPIRKNSVSRMLLPFKEQEAHDLAIQDLAKETETEMYAYGTGADGVGNKWSNMGNNFENYPVHDKFLSMSVPFEMAGLYMDGDTSTPWDSPANTVAGMELQNWLDDTNAKEAYKSPGTPVKKSSVVTPTVPPVVSSSPAVVTPKTVFDENQILLNSNPAWKKSPYYSYNKGSWSRVDANGAPTLIPQGDPAESALQDYYFKQGNFSDSLVHKTMGETTDNSQQTPLVSKGMPKVDTALDPSLLKERDTKGAVDALNTKEFAGGGSGFTAGDYVGMASSAIGSVSQMWNTIQAAKNTKPVVNHYRGVNEKAIQTTNEAIDETGYGKDIAKRALERVLNNRAMTSRGRNRGSAMSINSLRAMDIGTDVNLNEAEITGNNQLESTFSQQKLGLLSNRAQLESQQTTLEAQGQTQADDANAANLDNFYTNFGQNLADMSTTGQALGRDLNQNKYNRTFLNILPNANRWGIGSDQDGNLYDQTTKPKGK